MAFQNGSELDDFRRQWQEEVSQRRQGQPSGSQQSRSKHVRNESKDKSLASHLGASANSKNNAHEDEGHYGTYDFDDMEAREEFRQLGVSGKGVHPESIPNRHPISALDHYEMAVVRETEGKLGESLELYRKAFKLDDCVDQIYKRKHFPASSFKPKAKDARPVSPTIRHKGASKADLTISALVASFADATIVGAAPIIAGDIPPPCPFQHLPHELLVEIVGHVASRDVATLASLSQVSKRFAYLIGTEDPVWKRLIHKSRFGLNIMPFDYSCDLFGHALELSLASLSLSDRLPAPPNTLPLTLPLSKTYPTYKHMFQHRPRIRFSGVYISTVNYTRPGANDANTLSWNTPIHVVTYYRYLRFFRDGSCISLLTTVEPLDVVPYLQKENIGTDFVATTTLPVGVMRDARRGRWKLSPPEELSDREPKLDNSSSPAAPSIEPEGTLTIETEGPTKAYQYTAKFELKSTSISSRDGSVVSARNTKLIWRGFWSFNIITGDWAEFGLRNDRAFVWSRVRSWGDA